jgi:redox-sensitive bicupin YhaK (pirin superfamily)
MQTLTKNTTDLSLQPTTGKVREVLYRTRGTTRGGITRLVSPSDMGELIKPFVFLDLFKMSANGPRMGMHPHSGIATVTVVFSGNTDYVETTGRRGTLPTGGVEWMQAGGGVWHGGHVGDAGHVEGFQLWLALPRQDENSPAQSRYLAPEEVQSDGPARVIIGKYGRARSEITTSASINYLHVKLADGEHWRYQPPADHPVAWVANSRGKLLVSGVTLDKEVALFEESNAVLEFVAQGETEFVLGSSAKHPHELVLGYYSVHTSQAALEQGEAEIRRIGEGLRARGEI